MQLSKKAKGTKFDVWCDNAIDPTTGAYSAPQTSYLDLRRPTFKIRRGRGRGGRMEREERVGRRQEGKGERKLLLLTDF